MASENFADIGKVEALRRLYAVSAYKDVSSLVFRSCGEVRQSSRLYVEGVDFSLVYFPLKHLGYKSVIGVTGPLYAGLARPRLLSATLGVSQKLDFENIRELWTGITVAAKEHGYEAVKLDLQPSPNGLYINLNATGETSLITSKRIPKPKSMDLLCVSGPLGAAYLGLQVLEKGREDFEKTGNQPDMKDFRMIVGDYLRPELECSTVDRIEDAEVYPSTGCFVTGGLADAVKRLSAETGLGVKVYADKIPFEGNSFEAGKRMDIDPVSAAMNGGDDMKILFTIPIAAREKFHREFPAYDIIGHLAQPEVGAVLVTPDGVELPMRAQGWKEEE